MSWSGSRVQGVDREGSGARGGEDEGEREGLGCCAVHHLCAFGVWHLGFYGFRVKGSAARLRVTGSRCSVCFLKVSVLVWVVLCCVVLWCVVLSRFVLCCAVLYCVVLRLVVLGWVVDVRVRGLGFRGLGFK